MPLPCTLLHALLFLRALRTFVAPLLLSVLLAIVLVLALLLLSMLLAIVLVLPLLLLSMLLPVVLVLPLLLLSMLLFGFGLLVLALLLLGMVLLFALLLVLCVSRSSKSKKQRQNGCVGDSNRVHLRHLCSFQVRSLALAQASCCRVDLATDGFAGHEKFHSPILLSTSGVIVGRYRQSVTEASG